MKSSKISILGILSLLLALVATACGPALTPAPTRCPTTTPTPDSGTGGEAELPAPDRARDAALAYLADLGIEPAPSLDLAWDAEDVTAEGMVGATNRRYTAGDWVVDVSYPIVAPEATIYDVEVTNKATVRRWQVELNAEMEIIPRQAEPTAPPLPTVEVGDAELAALAEGSSNFAWDIYHLLAADGGNIFYSPYSISLALAMTYAGARGETAQQMADALHFTLPQEQLHPTFNALGHLLAERAEQQREGEGDRFQLNVANALWGQAGYEFLETFLQVVETYYGAGLRRVDFASQPEASRQAINEWVEEQTEGRIEDLIPQGMINSLTRLVLANAIYFNASWAHQFSEGSTSDGPFYLLDGGEVTVPLMRQIDGFSYSAGDGYQAIELPYVGGQVSMVVLLPADGAFESFEAALDAQQVTAILSEMGHQQVTLTLPRFEYESQFSLKDVLIELGMVDAFTGDADLSGMTGSRDLFISAVVHKAFVSVDEEGTEAAAATAVVALESAAAAEPVEMTVDRPFIFFIRDEPTGTILFAGRVLDPSS